MSGKRETAAQRRKREEAEAAALVREERVTMTVDLVLAGMSDRGIHRAATAEGWKLERDQVDEIINDARAEILAAAGEGTRDDHVRMQLAKVRALYRRAVQAKELRVAAKCLEDERMLLGLQRDDRGPASTERARAKPEWHGR